MGLNSGWLANWLACAMVFGYAQCADFITNDNRQFHFFVFWRTKWKEAFQANKPAVLVTIKAHTRWPTTAPKKKRWTQSEIETTAAIEKRCINFSKCVYKSVDRLNREKINGLRIKWYEKKNKKKSK